MCFSATSSELPEDENTPEQSRPACLPPEQPVASKDSLQH